MKESRKERMKAWFSEHTGDLLVAGYAVGFVGLCAGVIALANKQAKQMQAELDAAASRGDTILPGPNGGWWIIPTPQEVEA